MQKTKKIVLFVILLVLLLPVLQNKLHLFTIPPLNGDFVLPEKPGLQAAGWLSGEFQADYVPYLEQRLGFHNILVRIYNQIDYALFRKAHAEGVVIGEKDVLYENDYLRAWTGEDFIGENTWDKKLRRLKYVQEYLKYKANIDLILVLEPSKARFSPEYIPDRYVRKKKDPANYTYILQKARELDIRFLDLNAYYRLLKDTSRYELYPKYGVHWSVYGMTLMADTLVRYLEKLREIDMQDIIVERTIVSDSLRDTDYDAAKPMNLLWELPHGQMAYPQLSFEDSPGKVKPSVLVVGDSYYWNIFNAQIPQNLFNNEAFWYFNALVYPDTYYDTTFVSDLNITEEVEKQNIILMMVTERFLFKYDWGFIDALYAKYTPELEPDIQYGYENNVRLNIDLFNDLIVRAHKQKKTLEAVVHQEAEYLFIKSGLTGYLETYGPAYYATIIANDTGWMRSIVKQAGDTHTTVEEALNKNADYMFWKEYPTLYAQWHAIQDIKNKILSDSFLLAQATSMFAPYHLPVDEMAYQEACRQYRELAQEKEREAELTRIEQSIRNDPEWLKAVTEKARRQNRTLDEMIRLDALWILEQKKK